MYYFEVNDIWYCCWSKQEKNVAWINNLILLKSKIIQGDCFNMFHKCNWLFCEFFSQALPTWTYKFPWFLVGAGARYIPTRRRWWWLKMIFTSTSSVSQEIEINFVGRSRGQVPPPPPATFLPIYPTASPLVCLSSCHTALCRHPLYLKKTANTFCGKMGVICSLCWRPSRTPKNFKTNIDF